MPETVTKEWFKTWFNSPYYDILYKDRDQQEADTFIHNLIAFLHPEPNCFMLDIACGKGRHAISLSKMGFTVTGVDLSNKNIKAAQKCENKKLTFFIHDMRNPYMVNYYSVIFNLFTSFGYFENARENNDVLKNIYGALKPGGTFVLDFVNINKVAKSLSEYEEKAIDGVKFQVKKSIKDGFLVKDIHVIDGAKQLDFKEKVHMFTAPLLKQHLEKQGFEIVKIFGDYNLGEFDLESSDRYILISKKK